MGGNVSTVSSSTPTRLSDSPPIPIPTQPNPQTNMSSQTPLPEQSPDPKIPKDPQPEQPPVEESPNEEAEEEEGECGFCLFMKAGGCKDSFVGWENCIKEAEETKEDIVEKCFEATSALRICMEAHADYYEPILRAEKKAEEEAIIELETEKENENSGSQEEDYKDTMKKSDG